MKKIIITFLFLSVLALCQAKNKMFGEYCEEGDTCMGDTICGRPENCRYGICRCQDGHIRTKDNSCKTLMKLNEDCRDTSDCFDGGNSTTCSNRKCLCNSGLSANDEMTKCAKHVGDRCSNNNDCNSGVTMECKDSKCVCKSTHKEHNRMCISYELGDECTSGNVCVAGSCRNKQCSCANELVAYLKRYCIHKDAKTEIGKGEECTTFATAGKDGKYCGKELTCKRCPNQNKYVCQGASTIKTGLLAAIPVMLAMLNLYKTQY